MTLIKDILLCIIGLSGGFIAGSGIFAFITMIGIFPRLADRTNTADHIKLYENAIIWGGSLGNLIIVFGLRCPLGEPLLLLYGLFSGIYVGCVAMTIAEALKVIPILVDRVRLKYGFAFMVLAIALGKSLGTLYQLW